MACYLEHYHLFTFIARLCWKDKPGRKARFSRQNSNKLPRETILVLHSSEAAKILKSWSDVYMHKYACASVCKKAMSVSILKQT